MAQEEVSKLLRLAELDYKDMVAKIEADKAKKLEEAKAQAAE